MTTVAKIKAVALTVRYRVKRKTEVFQLDYNGTRMVMTSEQAAKGAWKRDSEFVEVVW